MILLLLYDISPALTFSNSTSSHNSIIQLIFAIWQLLYVRTYTRQKIHRRISIDHKLHELLFSVQMVVAFQMLFIHFRSQPAKNARKERCCMQYDQRSVFLTFWITSSSLFGSRNKTRAIFLRAHVRIDHQASQSYLFVSPASIKKRYQKYHSIRTFMTHLSFPLTSSYVCR